MLSVRFLVFSTFLFVLTVLFDAWAYAETTDPPEPPRLRTIAQDAESVTFRVIPGELYSENHEVYAYYLLRRLEGEHAYTTVGQIILPAPTLEFHDTIAVGAYEYRLAELQRALTSWSCSTISTSLCSRRKPSVSSPAGKYSLGLSPSTT